MNERRRALFGVVAHLQKGREICRLGSLKAIPSPSERPKAERQRCAIFDRSLGSAPERVTFKRAFERGACCPARVKRRSGFHEADPCRERGLPQEGGVGPSER